MDPGQRGELVGVRAGPPAAGPAQLGDRTQPAQDGPQRMAALVGDGDRRPAEPPYPVWPDDHDGQQPGHRAERGIAHSRRPGTTTRTTDASAKVSNRSAGGMASRYAVQPD